MIIEEVKGWDNLDIKSKHVRLMTTLAMLTLATTDQLNRAHYSRGSRTTTESLLGELYQQRYLEKVYWRRFDRGNPMTVWKLSGRAMRWLKRHNLAPAQLIRPSDNNTKTRSQLTHTIRAADLLVHGLELARQDPNLELFYASEPTLRRHPLIVGTGHLEQTIYPDGFLRIRKHRGSGDAGEAGLAFELTRTTDLERVKDKIAAWIAADGCSEYEELFGTPLLIVVWVTDQGDRLKRDQLAKACWQHMVETHQSDRADLFRFGMVTDSTTASEFFFNPSVFVQPGSRPMPTSLLPQSWRVA